jgi:transcriptional regulator with XRE-family HTH domain
MTQPLVRVGCGSEGLAVETSRVGEAVRAARARVGWSREALAYHSGVSWSAIAQIETGRRKDVRLTSLAALARALGVSVDYLIGPPTTTTSQLFQHQVTTYATDDAFVAAASPFLAHGVEGSHCLLAVTTPAKTALLRDALDDRSAHVEFADWDDWYQSPRHALERYDAFVTEKFNAGAVWIRVVAEAAWSGDTDAEIAAWTRYESLVNLAFASSPATILCTYDERSFPANAIADARLTHPEVVQGTSATPSTAYRRPEDYLLDEGRRVRARSARHH